MSTRLSGRVALVTGASRGIGAAVAKRLAAEGASVAVNYAGSHDAAHSVVEAITAHGGSARAYQADIRDAEQCAGLVDSVVADLGGLDILINNAGVTRDGLVVRMTDEDWAAVIETNLTGTFQVTRHAAKVMMKARAGAIVTISSVIGLVGNAGQANYAAAKAGAIGFTKSVARELAPRGVRANVIAPGFIETDMTSNLSPAVCEAALSTISMKRFGHADDVAAACAFLVSDEASYITGQVLAVDGGMTFV